MDAERQNPLISEPIIRESKVTRKFENQIPTSIESEGVLSPLYLTYRWRLFLKTQPLPPIEQGCWNLTCIHI